MLADVSLRVYLRMRLLHLGLEVREIHTCAVNSGLKEPLQDVVDIWQRNRQRYWAPGMLAGGKANAEYTCLWTCREKKKCSAELPVKRKNALGP